MQYISELGDWIRIPVVAYLKADPEMSARAVEIAKLFEEADKHAEEDSDEYERLTDEAQGELKRFSQEIYTALVRDDKYQFVWNMVIKEIQETQVPDDEIANDLIAAMKETAR